MNRLKAQLPSMLVLLGLGAYLGWFFLSRLPSLEAEPGIAVRRLGFALSWLVFPESLVEIWCGNPPEFSLADRLPVLAIAAAIGLIGWGLGELAIAPLGLRREMDGWERILLASAVGLNLLSTYVLAAGLFGWLTRATLTIPMALAAAGLLVAWRGRTDSRKGRPTAASQELSGSWLWIALPLAVVVLLGGMLPPLDFDVREYHLQAPKEFYQQGRITFLPHNIYANMPLGSEMLCLAAMTLAGDWWLGALAGKTVLAFWALLTALGLFAAGRRLVSTTAGVVAAVVYLSVPWIVQVSTSGLIDGVYAGYFFLAGYAMLRALRVSGTLRVPLPANARGRLPVPPSANVSGTLRVPPPAPGAENTPDARPTVALKWIALAGYLAGAAVACKYPAVLFVVAPLGIWLLWPTTNGGLPGSLRSRWRAISVFALSVFLGCGLWLAKNWVLTGNPTYPLLSGVFSSRTRTPEKDQQWNRVHRPHEFTLSALGKDVGRVLGASEWAGPLVIPLAVMGLVVRPRRKWVLGLAAWAAYGVAAWWLLTHRIDRFWIPLLPFLALIAGVGATWIPPPWCRKALAELPLVGLALALILSFGLASLPIAVLVVLGCWIAWRTADRYWLLPLLLVGVLYGFLMSTTGPGGYNRYFVSLARLRDDPERVHDPWHRYFNAHVKDGRVLLVGDADVFDLEVPIVYSTCFDDSPFEEIVRGASAEEVRTRLAQRGITHVYVKWREIERYRTSGYGFSEFVQPEVFQSLVRQGVLAPLPPQPNEPGRAYRVVRGP